MVVAYRRGSFRSVAQRDLGKPANFSYRPRRMDNRNAETQGLLVAQNHAARLDQLYDQFFFTFFFILLRFPARFPHLVIYNCVVQYSMFIGALPAVL